MGKFSNIKWQFYNAILDLGIREHIMMTFKELYQIEFSLQPEDAQICITDSTYFFKNRDVCTQNYEVCLVILTGADYFRIDELYASGIRYVLRNDYTTSELQCSINMMYEFLSMRLQSQVLENIYDSAQNSIVITDSFGVIQYANDYFLLATGFGANELLGELPRRIKSDVHTSDFYANLWDTISSGDVWSGFFVNRSRSGSLFYEEATISPIFNQQGKIVSYLKIGKLVNREKLLTNELDSEIKAAKDLITYMLPLSYTDEMLSFDARLKAYNYLGGDFVCFEKINDHKYVIGLIDVMGHGASATLIGLKAITIFQTMIQFASLDQSVFRVNEEILKMNRDDVMVSRYLSGIFIEIDTMKERLSYISAGHPDFYIKRKALLDMRPSNNMLIGIQHLNEIKVDQLPLCEIEYVFLYSDGLIENDKGRINEAYERLEYAIIDAQKNKNRFLKTILEDMIGYEPVEDDITLSYIGFNAFQSQKNE